MKRIVAIIIALVLLAAAVLVSCASEKDAKEKTPYDKLVSYLKNEGELVKEDNDGEYSNSKFVMRYNQESKEIELVYLTLRKENNEVMTTSVLSVNSKKDDMKFSYTSGNSYVNATVSKGKTRSLNAAEFENIDAKSANEYVSTDIMISTGVTTVSLMTYYAQELLTENEVGITLADLGFGTDLNK